MRLVEVAVDAVEVPEGRRELRGVEELMASIQEVGLLNPITVSEDLRLIAGFHRLEAFRRLGRATVPVVVVGLDEMDATLAEIDENLMRSELTVLERAELVARRKEVYEGKYPAARKPKGGRPSRNDEMISQFTAETAAKVGVTPRTVQHELQIANRLADDVKEAVRGTGVADSKVDLLALARMEPERQRVVAEELTNGLAKTVREAARNLDRREQLRAVERYVPPVGRYRVIVADPPWAYDWGSEDITHRGATPYPVMSVEAICALDVPADDTCVLWLWSTNAFMKHAFAVLDAWGFTDKTILTWVKDRMGVGNWLRGQTEHCILAVKGKPVVRLTGQSTVLHAPVREHSRKPDAFYKLVEELCPATPRLELFARERREGWVAAGAELPGFTDDGRDADSGAEPWVATRRQGRPHVGETG